VREIPRPPCTHAHVSSHVCYDLTSMDTGMLSSVARSCISFTIFSSLQRGRLWVSCEETSTSGKIKSGGLLRRCRTCGEPYFLLQSMRTRSALSGTLSRSRVTYYWNVSSFGVRLFVYPVVVSPAVPVTVSFYIRHVRTWRY
jgi:hypothetical protein